MGEVFNGVTSDQLAAALATLPSFINNGQFQTVSQLFANSPAGPDFLGKLARVSDLWGSVRTTMICEQDASGYYWRPQRTDYASAAMTPSGSMTLTPLVTAPLLLFTGNLLGSVNVTPTAVNAWPGATFRIVCQSALGLFGINIGGLIGGGTVPLLSGSDRTITYHSGTGWAAA